MSELGLLAQELSDASIAANTKLDARFCEAVSTMDLPAAMACFAESPDLVVLRYGAAFRGPEAVRRFWADLFSKVKTIRMEINEVTRWSQGETVFAVGRATYRLESLDGIQSTLNECWSDARQKVSGRWVYILHHAARIP